MYGKKIESNNNNNEYGTWEIEVFPCMSMLLWVFKAIYFEIV